MEGKRRDGGRATDLCECGDSRFGRKQQEFEWKPLDGTLRSVDGVLHFLLDRREKR